MLADRKKVPEQIQAEVITNCRRRCCICFGLDRDLDVKSGQIAHLDRNSSNNTIDNLAFLCLSHHDQYDSVTSQSKSFRPSEVKAYRDELCTFLAISNTQYGETKLTEDHQRELKTTVCLEISLLPHEWKNLYMHLYPGHFAEGTFERKRDYVDVWEMLVDVGTHEYSKDDWQKYLPLFTKGIERLTDKLERVIMMFGDEVSTALKLVILKTNTQLHSESRVYSLLPQLIEHDRSFGTSYQERFNSVLRVLGEISRLADRDQEALSNNT